MHGTPQPTVRSDRTFTATITSAEAGSTVAEVCRTRWPTYSPEDWQDLFDRQGLLLNQCLANGTEHVTAGDLLACTVPTGPEPDVRTDYRILFRDDHLAVIDKPGDLPCHPAGRYYAHTLAHLLLTRENFPAVHLANRLDRETSGLVVVALTSEAASRLGSAFMRRDVEKTYLTAVEGIFPETPCQVSGWLYLARGATVRRKRVFVPSEAPHPDNSLAVETHFRRLGCVDGLSWLEVVPLTGRPHQIRATLKGIGFPIVGDKLYGIDESIYARFAADSMTSLDRKRLRLPRQVLHAARLAFPHPLTGERLVFDAPLPDDLASLSAAPIDRRKGLPGMPGVGTHAAF